MSTFPSQAPEWEAAARALLRRCPAPAALLDGEGRVQLVNATMARLLGTSERALGGVRWAQVRKPADRVEISEPLDGHRLVRLELASPSDGLDRAELEVSTADDDFGRLLSTVPPELAERGTHCFDVLYRKTRPCKNCPLQDLQPGDDTFRDVFFRRSKYHVVTAEPVEPDRARVRLDAVDDGWVGMLVEARLAQLAKSAGLSPREQQVYRLLILGRSTDEIAQALSISARTAKFHVRNVLRKLGADSRLELLRLLL